MPFNEKTTAIWVCNILSILLVFPSLDQPSLQHIVVIYDLHEAPVSEVLIIAEEQLEQDVLQPRDVDAPVSSAEDDKAELDKGTFTAII